MPHVCVMRSLLQLYAVTGYYAVQPAFEWRHGNDNILTRLGHCNYADAAVVDGIIDFALDRSPTDSELYLSDEEVLDSETESMLQTEVDRDDDNV